MNQQDQSPTQGQPQTQPPTGQVEISIARIYVKDLSYELPRAPQIFQQQYQPEMKVEVNVTPKKMGNQFYEVSLNVLLDAKVGNESIFLIEIEQAGIFEIKNATPQQLDHILLVFCPQTLFPYARTHIDHAMNMGSLPPIMLAPINFEAMRAQREAAPPQGGVN
jgi:preprotein translocase subunit SecB